MEASDLAVLGAVRGGLVDWLATRAAEPGDGLATLFAELCERLVRAGVPLWRVSLGLERLHPEESGSVVVWRDGELTTRETRPRAGILTSEAYLNSPTRVVDETGRPFRRRLAGGGGEGDPGMPLLRELREEGATDYLMLPLAFSDTSRTAVASFATRAPGGFTDGHLAGLELASRLVSP